jgi:hypothetical protein
MAKITRRKFLDNSSKAMMIGAGLAMMPASDLFAQNEENKMFVHHVYFWMKDPSSATDREKLLKGLKSLQKVETIKTYHVGVPADTNREVIDRSYSFSLLLIFDNKKDQDIYQEHPVHLQFVKECSETWKKVIVYDSVNA